MKNLFTQYSEDVTTNNIEKYNGVEDEEGNNFNKWSHWIENINDRVKILLADNEGDRENAHYLPKLADYVIKMSNCYLCGLAYITLAMVEYLLAVLP